MYEKSTKQESQQVQTRHGEAVKSKVGREYVGFTRVCTRAETLACAPTFKLLEVLWWWWAHPLERVKFFCHKDVRQVLAYGGITWNE